MIKTKKQHQELSLLDHKTRRASSNGLLAARDPHSSKGSIYFVGRMQQRPPDQSKPVSKDCQIGLFRRITMSIHPCICPSEVERDQAVAS